MRSWKVAIVLAVISLLLAFALAAAQEPVRDFAQLNTRLKPGDTIVVGGTSGVEVRGTLRDIGASSLAINHTGPRVFQADEVREVTVEKPRSKGKWAGLGFLGGAAIGAALTVATMDDADAAFVSRSTAALIIGGLLGGAGAVAGLVVASSTPVRTLVYRAPDPASRLSARFSVVPFVTPRAKGVAVAYSF